MRTFLLVALALCACSGSDDSTPPRPATATPSNPGPSDPGPSDPGPSDPGPSDPARSEATSPAGPRLTPAEIRSRVAEGRRFARAQEWAQARRVFHEIVARADPAARLLCEAGYASLRAGDFDSAQVLIERALPLYGKAEQLQGAMREGVARCLHNYGLVMEHRGQWSDALRQHQRSFRLRPHNVVYEHIVEAQVRCDDATERERIEQAAQVARVALGPTESLEEQSQALRRATCGQYDTARCNVRVEQRLSGDAAGAVRGAALLLAGDERAGGTLYLSVQSAGGWVLVTRLNRDLRYDPRARRGEDAVEWVSLDRFELVELDPAPGRELRVQITEANASESYAGDDCGEDEDACATSAERRLDRTEYICAAQRNARLGCAAVPRLSLRWYAEGSGEVPPMPRDGAARYFGVGFATEVANDVAAGTIALDTSPYEFAGLPYEGAEPPRNTASAPEPSADLRGRIALADFVAKRSLRPSNAGLPSVPNPTRAAERGGLVHGAPWSPPGPSPGASAEDAASLASLLARQYLEEQESYLDPRCESIDRAPVGVVEWEQEIAGDPPYRAGVVRVDGYDPVNDCAYGEDEEDAGEPVERRAWPAQRFLIWRPAAGGAAWSVAAHLETDPQSSSVGRATASELVAGGPSELRLPVRREASGEGFDARTRITTRVTRSDEGELVCALVEPGLRCAYLSLAFRSRHLPAQATGSVRSTQVLSEQGYRLRADYADGQVTITVAEGAIPPQPPGREWRAQRELGTHRVEALVTDARFAVPVPEPAEDENDEDENDEDENDEDENDD